MSDQQPKDENLSDAFHTLGKNIVDIFRTAWESPERKNLQQELENGLNELGNTIKKEIDDFSTSPTGQQIKNDVESLKERVRSGETEDKVRSEVLNALRFVNNELERVSQEFSGRKSTTESTTVPPTENPPGPDSPI